jgi:hypothetical protein
MSVDIFTLSLSRIEEILETDVIDPIAFRSEVLKKMEEISVVNDSCKVQIMSAKQNAAANKQYSDREWYRKVTNKKNQVGREHQRLQMILGLVNKHEKNKRAEKHDITQKNFEVAFTQAAKIILDHDTFEKICIVAEKFQGEL